jgi:hypothetical protein
MRVLNLITIAAFAAPFVVAAADSAHLLTRQDDSSCAAKFGPSFQWCEGVGVCVDEAAGYTCCITGKFGPQWASAVSFSVALANRSI